MRIQLRPGGPHVQLSAAAQRDDPCSGDVQDVCERRGGAAAGHDGVGALPRETSARVHAAVRWLRTAERCCDSCLSCWHSEMGGTGPVRHAVVKQQSIGTSPDEVTRQHAVAPMTHTHRLLNPDAVVFHQL